MSHVLNSLNEAQRDAAGHLEGPILVLAGAGSGKTKTLTHRIAHMIEQGVRPWNILALTFTNKAAEEMRHRISNLVGPPAHDLWMSTFHSACVRILRRDIEAIGYSKAFNIYDTDDQVRLIRSILKGQNIDTKKNPPRGFVSRFDDAKRQPLKTDQLGDFIGEKYDVRTQRVFLEYQKRMKQNNVLDFNDLINFTIQIFQENPDILERRQRQFQYLMVDEYQDTNASQYTLIRLLSGGTQNIMVVGDDDQSIYGFRGADIQNILRFQKDFTGSKVVRLERNYRSTKTILAAANAVVCNNSERMEKTMWTEAEDGDPLKILTVGNEWKEAEAVANSIKEQLRDGYQASDIAIIYRTNAQSSIFEQIFYRYRISHVLVGAKKFFDRAEIRDFLAYLKLILNPCDQVSFFRAISTPRRGIGPKSLDEIVTLSQSRHMGILDAADLWGAQKKAKSRKACLAFCELIYHARDCIFEGCSGVGLLEMIDKKIGYSARLELEDSQDSKRRIENIKRLYDHVAEVDAMQKDNSSDSTDPLHWLQEFLDNAALVAGDDDLPESAQQKVTLLTAHLSKGLEFPVVYVVGMNEGSFPHSLSVKETEIEEERRLVYVAFTRAKKRLFLTRARTKMSRNRAAGPEFTEPSRFIKEIPATALDFSASKKKSHTPSNRAARLGFKSSVESKPSFSRSRLATKKSPGALPKTKATGSRLLRSQSRTSRMEPIDTGNDSESYHTQVPESLEDLQPGTEVLHPKFGLGKITGREGYRTQLKLNVQFNRFGYKKLMASHCNLELVIR